MSTIEGILYDRLVNFAGLQALVKARIFPLQAPQDIKKPFVVFQRISANRAKIMEGPSYVARPRMQVDCYAQVYEDARAIAEQVRLALDGWRDLSGDLPVKGSSLVNDQDLWEPGTDPKLCRVSMDFMITHDETTT